MSETSVEETPGSARSRTRTLSTPWLTLLIAWTVAVTFLCINQQFALRFFVEFTLLNTEYYWGLIALLVPLAFIIFPVTHGISTDRVPWYDVLLFLASTGLAVAFIATARDSAASGWEFSAPRNMTWLAIAMWALTIEALRRAGGLVLMTVMLVFSIFPLVADVIPAPFRSPALSLHDTAAYHVFSTESILGIPMRAFAETVIGFLVFGTALQYTGAGSFFINFAFALCGRYRGGAAKVAIFSSGLLGSMSGSVISNVVTTGTMTIPAMKRTGFRPATAGAIEACASTGAVLAPPVMGATAFVMAEFLNISYAEVALAAAVPAILYYYALFMQIDSHSGRHGMVGLPEAEIPRARDVFKDGWYFIFVIILLIFLLLVMKRENWAPWLATALLLVLNQLFSPQRWKLIDVRHFLEGNGRLFVELAAILAGAGLLVGAFSATGLTGPLTTELLFVAGGDVFLLLIMGALTSFILGMGMTITACYIFLAVLLAPALIKVGLNPLAVHMFIMYWGMVSFITPPVALAAFAASSIAKASPIETGVQAMKIGAIIYFVPFFFVLNPSMVLQGDALDAVGHIATALLGITLVSGALQGYVPVVGDLRRCGALEWPVRAALVAGGLMFAAPGGGLMPLSPIAMTAAAAAVSLPALAIAWAMRRRPIAA